MAQEPDQVDLKRRVAENENPTPEEARERAQRVGSADEVEATRAEIEQTRAEMTETIDALQEKLDPRKIRQQATTRATNTARNTGSRAVETVKQNSAVPLAVGGLLGLFLLRRLLSGGGGGGSENVVLNLRTGRTRRF